MRVFSWAVNLLDRYLLREWLKIFGLLLVATLGLLLLQAAYDDLSDLLGLGANAADVGVYFAVKLPGYLALVLPLALLLSLLYTLGQLHRNGEIIAQRAAGLGLARITQPLWLAGALLCLLVGWLNASVVPWSVEEARAIKQRLGLHAQTGAAAGPRAELAGWRDNAAFDNRRAGRMWFFNRFNPVTRRGLGVTVSELDSRRREITRLMAREARPGPGGRGWVFLDGRQIQLDPETGVILGTEQFSDLPKLYYMEDPALIAAFDLNPLDLSFRELDRLMDYLVAEDNPKVAAYAVRYYGLLADALVPFIIILLGVPFAVSGVRVNPAVGVTKSIGLFAMYYLLVKTAAAAGGSGLVPPLWAALLPNAVMLMLGGILFARAQ